MELSQKLLKKIMHAICIINFLTTPNHPAEANNIALHDGTTIDTLMAEIHRICELNPNISYFCSKGSVALHIQNVVCKPFPKLTEVETFGNFSLSGILSVGISRMDAQMKKMKTTVSDSNAAIFVLGNTGSGKTTVTEILAGNLNNLHATKSPSGNLVVIDDKERIGGPSTRSNKLIPEYVVHSNSSAAFWDCPGFNDTREPETDVAAMYFLRYALSMTKSAKFLFTVNHLSVMVGHANKDFDIMVTHAVRMLKNVSKLKHSIGLVVTKVGEFDPTSSNLKSDEDISAQIVEFLSIYVHTTEDEIYSLQAGARKIDLQNKVKFVRGLYGENETDFENSRIFFIRSPSKCGPLGSLDLTLDTCRKLTSLLNNQLKYSPVTPEDFRFTLNKETLAKVKTTFIPDISHQISKLFLQTFTDFKKNFEHDFYKRPENRMSTLNITIERLSTAHHTQIKTSSVTSNMKMLQKTLPFKQGCTYNFEMQNFENMMEFLKMITNQTIHPSWSMTLWERSKNSTISYLEGLKGFYEFCDLTKKHLTQYPKQMKLTNLQLVKKNQLHIEEDSVLSFLRNYYLVEVPQRVQVFWSDCRLEDRKYLAQLVHEYTPRVKFTCNKSSTNRSLNQIVISGRILKLSDATNPTYWPKECTESNVNEMLIVGMEKIYLDEDFISSRTALHLAIIAPEWELANFRSHQRFIILDGVKPKDYNHTSRDIKWNKNGQAGVSGADAGSFYGIYEHFKKKSFLHVSSIGGTGGDGQDGQNGNNGKPGRDAEYKDFPQASFSDNPPNLHFGYPMYGYIKPKCYTPMHCWYTIAGENGQSGGNGGNGGDGGAPGRAGHIEILQVKNTEDLSDVSSIKIRIFSGDWGKPGKGGKGGVGGLNGKFYSCAQNSIGIASFLSSCYSSYSWKFAEDGKDGLKGMASRTYMLPKQPKFQMWRLINEFKAQFLDDNSDFISKLNSDQQVTKFMMPLGFAKELEFLEQNSFVVDIMHAQNKMLFLQSYYENFRKRLDAYSAYLSESEGESEESATLDVIYSVVLGKIAILRGIGHRSKVIITNEYFDTLNSRLQTVQKSKREVIIQQEDERFEETLNTQVEEANRFVRETAYPAIEMATETVGELNNKLNLELIELQKRGENEVINATRAKELYKKMIPLKVGLDFINFVGTVCSFLGPKGVIVGQILSNSALLGKSFTPEIKAPQVQNLPPNFNKSLFKNKQECTLAKVLNIDKESELWEKVVAELHNDTLAELKEYVYKRRESVGIYKQAIKNCSKNGNPLNIAKLKLDLDKASKEFKTAVAKMVKDVEGHMSRDEIPTNKTRTTSEKTPNINKVLKNCVKALNSLEVGTELGINIWKDVREIEKFTSAIQEAEKNVKVVKAKRAQFVFEFLPQIETMENDLKKETSQLSGKSQAALSVKQWEVKGMLKKMRQHVRGFTAGMEITEEFQLAIDCLDEAFTLLVDLYEHIERYEERKQLADFIAKVNNANGVLSKITDDELRGVLSRLNFHIDSNLFLEEYQSAVHSFKQWVFPFAAHYFNDRKIINETIKPDNTEEIVQFYMNEFQLLRTELAKYKAMTVTDDNYLFKLTFTSDAVSSESFFVWENTQWQTSIRRLLKGERIQLMADVDMRGHPSEIANFFWEKSAIKYKTIELSLKVKNGSRQDELNEKLNHFHLNMTHSGVSLYKVMGKQYVIFDSSQSYRYSFERIGNNRHVSVNAVKHKVSGPDVDFLMSPYTWWTLQLIDVKPGGMGFADLNEFYDQVDLHLEGEGVYLDEEQTTDDFLDELSLDQHYEMFDPEDYNDRSGSHECQYS